MSEDTIQYTPSQVDLEPTADRAIPSINKAQAPPPIESLLLTTDLSYGQNTWDTIIVCTLLSVPFGIPMSDADIANAVNGRVIERKDSPPPIGAHTVKYMFNRARSEDYQQCYAEMFRCRKWEAVRERRPGPIWKGRGEDREVREAFTIWVEAVRVVKPELFLEDGSCLLDAGR